MSYLLRSIHEYTRPDTDDPNNKSSDTFEFLGREYPINDLKCFIYDVRDWKNIILPNNYPHHVIDHVQIFKKLFDMAEIYDKSFQERFILTNMWDVILDGGRPTFHNIHRFVNATNKIINAFNIPRTPKIDTFYSVWLSTLPIDIFKTMSMISVEMGIKTNPFVYQTMFELGVFEEMYPYESHISYVIGDYDLSQKSEQIRFLRWVFEGNGAFFYGPGEYVIRPRLYREDGTFVATRDKIEFTMVDSDLYMQSKKLQIKVPTRETIDVCEDETVSTMLILEKNKDSRDDNGIIIEVKDYMIITSRCGLIIDHELFITTEV